MANYMGGSATAMASQIAEGFILVSTATIRSYTKNELGALRFELEKIQRDTRALVPPQDDAHANQARNRKISRLSSALQVIGGAMSTRR